MTNKEFVTSMYPGAYFRRGSIFNNQGAILWQDEYGIWAEDWDDTVVIDNAWEQLAKSIQYKFLKKLES
jgi:hypothetical protein